MAYQKNINNPSNRNCHSNQQFRTYQNNSRYTNPSQFRHRFYRPSWDSQDHGRYPFSLNTNFPFNTQQGSFLPRDTISRHSQTVQTTAHAATQTDSVRSPVQNSWTTSPSTQNIFFFWQMICPILAKQKVDSLLYAEQHLEYYAITPYDWSKPIPPKVIKLKPPIIFEVLVQFQKDQLAKKSTPTQMTLAFRKVVAENSRGYLRVYNQLIEEYTAKEFMKVTHHLIVYDAYRKGQTPIHLRLLSLNCACKFCASWIRIASSSDYDNVPPGLCKITSSKPDDKNPEVLPTEDCHCFQLFYSFYPLTKSTWD